MKISLNWIKNYVDPNVSVDVLTHKLTMAGLEVEDIESKGSDTIIELEVTPNRADCLSHLGMAREVATIFDVRRTFPKNSKLKLPVKKCAIQIDDLDACSVYYGAVIEEVSIKLGPKELSERLEPLGIRSINNIVDITNFCLFESGQPLHAFDYDKIVGKKIIVRRAKKGESIVTIDDVERKLDPSILIIADAEKPIAIAGIMGGKNTEVTSQTKNILLEAAYFDTVLIRRASRKLGLSSDSSYRFERGVDYGAVDFGFLRAIDFILKYAGGTISKYAKSGGRKKIKSPTIQLPVETVNQALGSSFKEAKCKKILKNLDFQVESKKAKVLSVTPPSFRPDIKQDVDLIEEIGRVIGYDELPYSLPKIPSTDIPTSPIKLLRDEIRQQMTGQGFSEIITFSTINADDMKKIRLPELKGIAVSNPLSLDQAVMRPISLPNVMGVVATNLNKGQKDLSFYEIGKVYPTTGEQDVISLLMTGVASKDWRLEKKASLGFYDIKGSLENLFYRINKLSLKFKNEQYSFFIENQSASVYEGTKK